MANVLALIPARAGSKGVPLKNFKALAGGASAVMRAIACARDTGIEDVYVSTDHQANRVQWLGVVLSERVSKVIERPPELAQDDTPMLAVVQHALAQIPGPPEQVIVLLQPTQPLRTSAHVQAAIQLLRETQADSVVSVVELPRTHSPELVCQIVVFPSGDEKLRPWPYDTGEGEYMRPWSARPSRRQDAQPAFLPDGTVYAFYRRNLSYGQIYGPGDRVRPLIIPAEESCALDTEADWAEAERRLQGR